MSGYLFLRTTPDLLKKREYISFKVFIGALDFYLIANSLWTMQEFGIISLPKWAFNLVCFFSLSAIQFNTLCFYKLTMMYYGYSNKGRPLYEFLGALPYIIVEIMLFISMFNGMMFSVPDGTNISQNELYFVMYVVAFFYFAIIFSSSVVRLVKSKSPQTRRNCITIFLLVIFLISWAIIDNLFDGLTILPIAIFSVILTLFTTFQQSSINTDALTQMNNRRKAMEYLSSQMVNVSEENPIYLYISDINSFKKINDNYGHLEGDNALIIVAESIKEAVSDTFGFAARYGGDEFIITIKSSNKDYNTNEIIEKIDTLAKEKCITANKPYIVSIAAGCIKCTNPKKAIEEYLNEADDLLYKQKHYNDNDETAKE